jgi:hypothetical protein
VIHTVRKSADFTAIQKGNYLVQKFSNQGISFLSILIKFIGVAASDVFTAADVQIQKTIMYNLK